MVDLDSLLRQVDQSASELLSLHKELVKIESVNTGQMPTGNESNVADIAKQWLDNEGIETEVVESAPGRGNLIANMPGESEKNKLLLVSHLDVVPVEDAGKWNYNPFGAEMDNGRVYGRGTYDCKGLLASQMLSMAILRRNGLKLSDNLVLVSGADEESGGRYGLGWLVKNHPEKIQSPLAINEGGGTHVNVAGTTTYLMGVGEKGRLEIQLTIKGASAHASTPWLGENASYKLSSVLNRIQNYEATKDTSVVIFQYLSSLAIEDVPTPDNIDRIIEGLQPKNPQLASVLRALSRMTLTPTMVRGGIKSNSIPETISLICDVRTLPHQDDRYVLDELEGLLGDMDGVEIDVDYMAIPNSSDYDTEFAHSLKKATEVSLNRTDLNWVPSVATGFTDSRFLRPLGTTTYGFNGMDPSDDPLLNRMHGTDESIGVKSLTTGAKIMLALAIDVLDAH